MPSSAADIGAVLLLLLVLPGFLAYRSALARRADPTRRSPLWQLSEILEYSLYVHVAGVGLLFGLVGILQSFGIDTHVRELPRQGPLEFIDAYFVEGMLLLTLYPVYVTFAATLMGAYDLPGWARGCLSRNHGPDEESFVNSLLALGAFPTSRVSS